MLDFCLKAYQSNLFSIHFSSYFRLLSPQAGAQAMGGITPLFQAIISFFLELARCLLASASRFSLMLYIYDARRRAPARPGRKSRDTGVDIICIVFATAYLSRMTRGGTHA